MGIKIQFDSALNPIEPTLILANHSGNRLGVIKGALNINITDELTGCPELSFSVSKKENQLWDSILDIKLVHCLEWDTWLQIQIEINDSDATVKNVNCKGLCQSELSQTLIHGLEFNTEEDIERDDYERSIIYNFENPNASILHGIFDKIPHYRIAHVDASIASQQKTFSFDGISIEDALNEIAEECHCLVVYNNGTDPETNLPAREVSFYDLESICKDCGYRDEFTDECPKCGSKNIKYGYGKDTRIFVSKDNLTDEIIYTSDLDSVKNCFKLVAGDDVMTSAIQACNPNGTDYIWYISEELKSDMPKELVEKIETYNDLYQYYTVEHTTSLPSQLVEKYNLLVEKYKPYNKDLQAITKTELIGYSSLMNVIYDVIDFEGFLQSGLMPIDDTINDTTAEKQAKLLTTESLSPIALSSVNEYTEEIINQMVLAVARIIVDNRYDVKIKTSKVIYDSNADEGKKNKWVGSFTVTNYADEDLTADTGDILIYINKDYERYIRQRVEKVLSDTDVEDYSISGLLKLEKTIDEFKVSIKPYNISVLMNLKDACDTCLDTLQAESIGNQSLWKDLTDGVDMYDKYYLNYYNKLEALLAEIAEKEREQGTIKELHDFIASERNAIQDTLNFEKYLGNDLWLIFCSYRREDIYKNENYISDSLNNAEIFENAREFYRIAQKEIFKSATLQHSISSTLKNLLVIPQFRPLVDSFELGNWLRIEVDGKIYRLRLIKYSIDFDNLEEIEVEFSDVTQTADGITDINSLLSKTSSMATSYEGVKRQATQGKETYVTVADWIENGLDATLSKIVDNRETQDVVVDKHGILIREYDDITESYYPTQMKFINSILALTTDNWRTIKTAIGNFIYQDPISLEYKTAYGVNAETLVGNLILGKELGIYNESASMCFNENGLSIYNDTNNFRVNPNSDILLSISKNDEKMFWVDENGMLHICGDGAGLDITANSSVTGLQSQLQVTSEQIYAKVEDTKSGLESQINLTASNIRQEVSDTANGLDSKIDLTASTIRQEVADFKSGLDSSIEQTATSIRTEINDTKEALESSISQTASSLETRISDLDSGLNSTIEQTASAIRAEVTDGDSKLQSSINETASEIRAEVKNVYDGLTTSISETASTLRAEADDDYKGLNASIELNAGKIENLVKADEGLESKITQTYDKVHTEVVNTDTKLSSQITVLSESITNEVTRAKDEEKQIWSKVNQTADSLTAEIQNSERMEQNLNNKIEMNVQETSSQITAIISNGRNFAYQTPGDWEDSVVTDQSNFIVFSRKIGLKNKGLESGYTIHVHFDIKFSADFIATGTGAKNSYVYIDKNPTGTHTLLSIPNQKSQLESIMASPTREGTISFSFTLADDIISASAPEYMMIYLRFDYYRGTVWWKKLMVECGNKPGAWLSAPEDSGINNFDMQTVVRNNKKDILLQAQRADGHEAAINLNADKINFIVKGNNSSEFSITERAIKMISDNVLIEGAVTIQNLDVDTRRKLEAAVISITTYYAITNSKSTVPDKTNTSIWSTSINWGAIDSSKDFVWQLTETLYGDNTRTRTEPTCITNGKEIASIKTQYYLHTSGTTAPSQVTWLDTCPEYAYGRYIWTRSYITYTDGTTSTTSPVYDSGLTQLGESVKDVASITTGLHSGYCGASAPSGPHVEGDLWVELGSVGVTDKDGNTTYTNGVVGFHVWESGQWKENKQGSTTILNGTITTDLIAAHAIVTEKLNTNAIKSLNYSGSSGSISASGSFFDLANGNISSPYFCIHSGGGIIGGWKITDTALVSGTGEIVTTLQSGSGSGSGINISRGGTSIFYIGTDGHVYIGDYLNVNDRIVCNSFIESDGYIDAKGGLLENGTRISSIYAPATHYHSGYIAKSGDGVLLGSNMFGPSSDGGLTCGYSSYRWSYIYAQSGTVSTSDEREKNILGSIDVRYKKLFMGLEPIMFTWKDKNFDNSKVHLGLGAQTTKKYADNCGISETEIAAIQHDYFEPDQYGRTDRYGINYGEIQMLTLAVTQDNVREIDMLKKRISELEEQVAALLS